MPVYKALLRVSAVVDGEVTFNAADREEAYVQVWAMPRTGELDIFCEGMTAHPTGDVELLEMVLVSAEGTLTEEGVV